MSENTAVLERSSATWLAPACLAAAVLLWGTSFMATKTALTGFGPQTLAACCVVGFGVWLGRR
jgi:drug/metabolite transporter (DMT)-like permease